MTFRLPSVPETPDDLTSNERAWIGFLRMIAEGTDPGPTLEAVQALRRALKPG